MNTHNTQCPPESPCVLVIFGASGDLTRRKLMPALFGLEREGLLDDCFMVVGFARSEKSDKKFRDEMMAAAQSANPDEDVDPKILKKFAARLHYVSGQYNDEKAMVALHTRLQKISAKCGASRYLYYLALPPDIGENLLGTMHGIDKKILYPNDECAGIMIEKPFGRDLDSARRLNDLLHDMFCEENVYRIDHYIAKETVRNLLVFRFGNAIFEHLWNRKYIDNVQITAAETIGIEGRGAYYDNAGIVRDMLQNHVLQVLALTAMDPPMAGDAESVRNKKLEVFKALQPIQDGDYVFGQYEGYRYEPNVVAGSMTPTFIAARMFINNWRWQGVPFYIRAGKSLAKRYTEIAIQFKSVPVCVFENADSCARLNPNVLVVRIQPDEGVRLSFSAKVPGREDNVTDANLDFRYADLGGQLSDAYERVILDSLRGKPTLFWRSDSIEEAWKFVAPLLEVNSVKVGSGFPNYAVGSWGPREANDLLTHNGCQWLNAY